MDVYRLGVVRAYVLQKIAPRDFSTEEIDGLRLAYDGDDELFEALFQEWMKQHLEYLRWYATVSGDYAIPLSDLLKPPVICHSPRRAAYERNLYVRYGLLFQAWERYRETPPLPLESLQRVERDVSMDDRLSSLSREGEYDQSTFSPSLAN